MRSALFCFIILFSLSLNIFSQYKWEQTNGPYGGGVKIFYDEGIIYAGTHNGVYQSKYEGTDFKKAGLQGKYITQIEICEDYIYVLSSGLYRKNKYNQETDWELITTPATGQMMRFRTYPPGIIIIATNQKESLISEDGGSSWEFINIGLPLENVRSILIADNSEIYLGFKGQDLFKSTDLGKTWQPKSSGLPQEGYITIMEDHSGNLYTAYTNGGVGVYRSTDRGDSWSECFFYDINFLHRGPGNYIYAANNRAIYRSTDGLQWNEIGAGINRYFLSFTVCQYESGELFFGMGSGLYKSTDAGENFKLIGLPIEIVPGVAVNSEGEYYACGELFIYRSSDYGRNWERVNSYGTSSAFYMISTFENSILVSYFYSGITRKNPDNQWSWPLLTYSKITHIHQAQDSTIYAVGKDTLFFSENDGKNWSKIVIPLNEDLSSVARYRNKLFLGTLGDGVYSSADSGITWNQVNEGLENLIIRYLLADDNDRLFAATQKGIFLYSGERWVNQSNASTNRIINSLMLYDKNVYAASDSGIYFMGMSDPGWFPLNEGLNDMNVLNLAVDTEGVLLAATEYGSVYRRNSFFTASADDWNQKKHFALYQNYPNPFNPKTSIEFTLPEQGFVTLKIYNILGEETAILISENLNAGNHKIEWNAASTRSDLPSGIYLYRIQSGSFSMTKKMVLVR